MAAQDSIREVVQRNVPSVETGDSLATAVRKMTDNRMTAVTVKADGALVGVVSAMDVMLCMSENRTLEGETVASCMTACQSITEEGTATPCVQLDENQQVDMALKIMAEAGVHHLLVTGADDQPIGLVSSLDLLARMIE